MSQSYAKLTYHCTFSTKDRKNLLYGNMRPRLHAYIARIINRDFGIAREVGGTDNHVHILCDLFPTLDVAGVMNRVKSLSSGWIHREFPRLSGFGWQRGYGAFSVSASVLPSVKTYIRQQEHHHKTLSFKEEFRRLLEKHGVEFDAEYLF